MERYQLRFEQFKKSLTKLEEAIDYTNQNKDAIKSISTLNNLIQQGIIQNFEFTHELAWKLLKDYLQYQTPNEIYGSRDATRYAFSFNLISDGELWMEMIKSRNETSHIYDDKIADEIFYKIINKYFPAFVELKNKFENL